MKKPVIFNPTNKRPAESAAAFIVFTIRESFSAKAFKAFAWNSRSRANSILRSAYVSAKFLIIFSPRTLIRHLATAKSRRFSRYSILEDDAWVGPGAVFTNDRKMRGQPCARTWTNWRARITFRGGGAPHCEHRTSILQFRTPLTP